MTFAALPPRSPYRSFARADFTCFQDHTIAADWLLRGSGDRNLIFAGDGDDRVSAAGSYSIFFGGNGNDHLVGNFDDITEIYGEAGDDRIFFSTFADAGEGNDSITGFDLIIAGDGHDRVQGMSRSDLIFGGGDDGCDTIMGGGGDDTVVAGGGDDLAYGGDGADRLRGGNGDDILRGGAGADDIRGGLGFDTADYRAASQAMVLDLSNPATNAGAALGGTLTSIEAIRGTGFAALEDALRFAAGTSVSISNDGTDTLVSYGADSVTLLGVSLNGDAIGIEYF